MMSLFLPKIIHEKTQHKMSYPVDDTQGQGFAVESIQDLNFRSGIKCLVGLLN